jgi:hypothetical protein
MEKSHNYKSRTSGELIPMIIVEFNDLPDFYWTKDQWEANGCYRGFIKNCCISIRDIKKVHKLLLNPEDFPTEVWEG